jgi:hypothetical protein
MEISKCNKNKPLENKNKTKGVSFYMNTEQIPESGSFSWNRERTTEEISDFISRKLAKFDVIASELEVALSEQ